MGIKTIFDLPIAKKENGVAIRQIVVKYIHALQILKRPTQQ